LLEQGSSYAPGGYYWHENLAAVWNPSGYLLFACMLCTDYEWKQTLEPSDFRSRFFVSNEDGKPTLNPKYEVTSNILI
jgi:hypothetical protein